MKFLNIIKKFFNVTTSKEALAVFLIIISFKQDNPVVESIYLLSAIVLLCAIDVIKAINKQQKE